MTDEKYYVFVKTISGGRKTKVYKTLSGARHAARLSYDPKIYVANDYDNLRVVE